MAKNFIPSHKQYLIYQWKYLALIRGGKVYPPYQKFTG